MSRVGGQAPADGDGSKRLAPEYSSLRAHGALSRPAWVLRTGASDGAAAYFTRVRWRRGMCLSMREPLPLFAISCRCRLPMCQYLQLHRSGIRTTAGRWLMHRTAAASVRLDRLCTWCHACHHPAQKGVFCRRGAAWKMEGGLIGQVALWERTRLIPLSMARTGCLR